MRTRSKVIAAAGILVVGIVVLVVVILARSNEGGGRGIYSCSVCIPGQGGHEECVQRSPFGCSACVVSTTGGGDTTKSTCGCNDGGSYCIMGDLYPCIGCSTHFSARAACARDRSDSHE